MTVVGVGAHRIKRRFLIFAARDAYKYFKAIIWRRRCGCKYLIHKYLKILPLQGKGENDLGSGRYVKGVTEIRTRLFVTLSTLCCVTLLGFWPTFLCWNSLTAATTFWCWVSACIHKTNISSRAHNLLAILFLGQGVTGKGLIDALRWSRNRDLYVYACWYIFKLWRVGGLSWVHSLLAWHQCASADLTRSCF